MRPKRDESGFALLMALVLILIAGVALANLSRRSVTEALDAKTRAEAVQRRWATTSCTATLLPDAERILRAIEQPDAAPDEQGAARGPARPDRREARRPPVPELRVSCRLAGLDYELVLCDEQAKVNVNALLGGDARIAEATRVIWRLVGNAGSDRGGWELRLRSYDPGSTDTMRRALPRLAGYGQVFDGASPAQLVGDDVGGGLGSHLTCWGDGKINIRRAPPQVVEAVCLRRLGPQAVGDILAARDADPYRPLDRILASARTLDDDDRRDAKRYMTDNSDAHAMWVVCRGPQRAWYTLAIEARGVRYDLAW